MGSLNFRGSKQDSNGWKKAAKVNCVVLSVMSVALLACTIAALSHDAQHALFFYDGDCGGKNVASVNLALHLLINIVSTLV
ncbi:Uu.00g097960.m01.CDS01 [Anthostomella pinea]|uniref:Uu.00g097960.m01.CDS01 n=1 Tax=Anthostomella pinea TaxID=933095 RepID=A0AAI8VD19_9PEZI|nr:Uu.00g097960.m01.CDS01 [Anthostomella pinea]